MESLTAKVDTSGLRAVIPELVSFGRRTTAEQCVTSMGMILQDAQTMTRFVTTGQMDSELDVIPSEIESVSGKKRPNTDNWTAGELIVISRTSENSKYNQSTGGRWRLQKPMIDPVKLSKDYNKRFIADIFMNWVIDKAEQMKKARHSSGHFLQAGFKHARDLSVSSPLFKNRYRARSIGGQVNTLNALPTSDLGTTKMGNPDAPTFLIVSENKVGDRYGEGNAVLDAKHRAALIAYAGPKVEDAVAKETAACEAELARRVDAGIPKFNRMLS